MNFNRLVTDSKEGLKRNISSRRENISITIEEFSFISRKYFTFNESFYFPEIKSIPLFLLMVNVVGHSTFSFMFKGFYDGIRIKYILDNKYINIKI